MAARKANRLSPKQQKFLEVYIKTNNATEAALQSGSPIRSATVLGSRMLHSPEVQAELARRNLAFTRKFNITSERIMAELAAIGFSNMMDYMAVGADGKPKLDWARLNREQAAALQEVHVEETKDRDGRITQRTKFKLADKINALEKLAKISGLIEKEQPANQTIQQNNITINGPTVPKEVLAAMLHSLTGGANVPAYGAPPTRTVPVEVTHKKPEGDGNK